MVIARIRVSSPEYVDLGFGLVPVLYKSILLNS